MRIVLPEIKAVFKDSVKESDIIFDSESGLITGITEKGTATGDLVLVQYRNFFVFPGFIDTHVHFRTPGKTEAENFETGSRAAIAGGVTTVMDMPNNQPPVIDAKSYHEKIAIVKKQSLVNFALYGGLTENNLDDLLAIDGLKVIKVYLASTTGSLLVKDLSSLTHPVGKIFSFHAEHEALILENEKKFGPVKTAYDHSRIRNSETAIRSTKEIIALQQKIKGDFHISHVSTPEEVELLLSTDLSFEVCPHHIFLSTDDYARLGFFLKCNPPLRDPESANGLLKLLRQQKIQMIATDHAPHLKSEKERTDKLPPSGIPSLEGASHLILQEAANGFISYEYAGQILSTRAAQRFLIAKRGEIKTGNFADLAIYNPDEEWIFSEKHIKSRCGWSPFTGRKFKGRIKATIVNGFLYDSEEEHVKSAGLIYQV